MRTYGNIGFWVEKKKENEMKTGAETLPLIWVPVRDLQLGCHTMGT